MTMFRMQFICFKHCKIMLRMQLICFTHCKIILSVIVEWLSTSRLPEIKASQGPPIVFVPHLDKETEGCAKEM
jgi:hypothetical protein